MDVTNHSLIPGASASLCETSWWTTLMFQMSFGSMPREFEEWEFLKGAKALDRVDKKTGFAYKYSEGSMAFPRLA